MGLISWVGPACGGPSALGMASFLNRFYWFGVVGALYIWGQLVAKGLFGVVGALYTWGQLVAKGLFGVVGLCTLGVN